MTNDVEHLYMWLLAICISSLGKGLFKYFVRLKNWVVFFIVSCKKSLYILDISPLSDVSFANIFSQSVACLFIFLMISFEMWKFWILMKSSLSIFKKWIVLFCVLKTLCPIRDHIDFPLGFLFFFSYVFFQYFYSFSYETWVRYYNE